MKKMKIFSLIECPMLGSLGPRTKTTSRHICPACGQEISIVREKIEYVFDGWSGQDIAKATLEDVFIVSVRLREAMEKTRILGVSFREILATRSELFLDVYGDTVLPTFYELVIRDTLEGYGWMIRTGQCVQCGRPFWNPTEESLKWVAGSMSEGQLKPRQVIKEEWQSQDIFFLFEPGPPVVTERLALLFKQLEVSEIRLDPAEWVSRGQ